MGLLQKKQHTPSRRNPRQSLSDSRTTDQQYAQQYAFRRNRTLTGSLSSNVSSVNEHGSELKSSRVHAHHLRRRRKHLGMLLSGLLVAAALLGFLIYQSVASIVVVSNTGVTIDSHRYEKIVQDYLFAHPLERFRFSLDTEQLTRYMQQNGSPEVSSVSPDMIFEGFGTSQLTIAFRQPVVAWKVDGTAVYVDSTGAAFATNYYDPPAVQVIDNTGIETEGNRVLASNRFLSFIGQVIGEFKQYSYTATEIALPANTTHQIVVTLADVPYRIKMSVDRPVGEQTEDARRSIVYLQQKNITADYIDVRVSNKAFYK